MWHVLATGSSPAKMQHKNATFGVRVAWLEQNQRRDKTIIWLDHLCYEEKLELLSLKKKKFQKTLLQPFSISRVLVREMVTNLSVRSVVKGQGIMALN